MRILCLTFGDEQTASTMFRILQYRGMLAECGIQLETTPARAFKSFQSLAGYDIVILQKTLLPLSNLRQIRKQSRCLIYDLDDLIWESPGRRHHFLTRWRSEFRLRWIARNADLCLTANHVLQAELVSRGARAEVLPMALDGEIWRPTETEKNRDPLVVGWSGAPKNLEYLTPLLPRFVEIQNKFPALVWRIHSGKDPGWENFRYEHVPYSPGREQDAVAGFDIGLLPLPDDAFARGKSPIKALQYMACGVVPVASGVGATREICLHEENALLVSRPQDWESHIGALLRDPEKRRKLSLAGRKTFLDQHERLVVGNRLAEILRTACGSSGAAGVAL